MNKQELIEKLIEIKNKSLSFVTWKSYSVGIDDAIALASKLDEREKVKVPQFVADWYEERKDDFDYNLWEYLVYWDYKKLDDFKNWIMNGAKHDPLITLVNMHQFGYEVEKEPKYRISIPKTRNYKNHTQILCYSDGKMFWCGEWQRFQTKFTRKELEDAGFGEVFNSPLFEIEEVE